MLGVPTKEFIWLTPSHLAAFTYTWLYHRHDEPSLLFCIVKSAPVLTLAAFVFVCGILVPERSRKAQFVFAGLIFSALGDIFLQLQTNESGYFLHGVVAFALSHVAYICAFGFHPLDLPSGIPIFAWATVYYSFLFPYLERLPVMAVAVLVYAVLIGTMFWRSIARVRATRKVGNRLDRWELLGCMGAGLFVVSDSTLVFSMFVHQQPLLHLIVMTTYYLAQLGISLSVLREEDQLWRTGNKQANKLPRSARAA